MIHPKGDMLMIALARRTVRPCMKSHSSNLYYNNRNQIDEFLYRKATSPDCSAAATW